MHGYDKPLQAPEPNDQAELVDLVLLLDTITATEPLWEDLPQPLPLFLHEGAAGLAEMLSMV